MDTLIKCEFAIHINALQLNINRTDVKKLTYEKVAHNIHVPRYSTYYTPEKVKNNMIALLPVHCCYINLDGVHRSASPPYFNLLSSINEILNQ